VVETSYQLHYVEECSFHCLLDRETPFGHSSTQQNTVFPLNQTMILHFYLTI
jgi:hypothetical protein